VLECPKATLTSRFVHHSCKAEVSKVSHEAPWVLVPQDHPEDGDAPKLPLCGGRHLEKPLRLDRSQLMDVCAMEALD